jgi:hypothetical protein
MTDTTFDFDRVLENTNHAQPYTYDPFLKEYIVVPIDYERTLSGVAPAGSLWSNADDMAKYLITQINRGVTPDGTRIVSEENLTETWTPAIEIGGGQFYGMGWTISDYHGQRLIQHGGGTAGFTTDLAFLPEAGLGVVVLTNHSLSIGFGPSVREFVFETAFGLEHTTKDFYEATETGFMTVLQQVIDGTQYSEEAIDPEAVADYLGGYERGVTLHLNDYGELIATTRYGDLPFLPTDNADVFVGTEVASGAQIRLSRSESGAVRIIISSLFNTILDATAPLTLAKLS